ncbi:MAG: OsmC family protein [Actinomycetota bacterium]|nr:OsmC family protein [Actinomycetota bacterium]
MSTERIRSAIESACSYLTDNPAEARYTDSAVTARLSDGLRCEVTTPSGDLLTDMPEGVGGAAEAPTPGWMMRAALATCDATLIAMRAAQEGVEVEALEVTVDSESDDRGLLGLDDEIPAGPLSTRVRVKMTATGASEDKLREIVEWADKHSPVGDAVRRAVPTTIELDTAAL